MIACPVKKLIGGVEADVKFLQVKVFGAEDKERRMRGDSYNLS